MRGYSIPGRIGQDPYNLGRLLRRRPFAIQERFRPVPAPESERQSERESRAAKDSGHRDAHDVGVEVSARFVKTEVNESLYLSYRFAGFKRDGDERLRWAGDAPPPAPPYLRVERLDA